MIELTDYGIFCQSASWTNGKPVSADFLYVICKLHVDGHYVTATDVVGVPDACFDFVIPKTTLYTVLRGTKKEDADTQATTLYPGRLGGCRTSPSK